MLKEFGPELLSKGYLLCPLRPNQKIPLLEGWPDARITEEDCLSPKFPEGCGIGFLCGVKTAPLCGIDVDVTDSALAEELRAEFCKIIGGDPAYRVGRAPKFLIPVRYAHKTTHEKLRRESDSTEAELDLVGEGAQFVAMGGHPSGGRYRWYRSDVSCDIPSYSELPEITDKQCAEIRDAFSRLAAKAGYVPFPASAGSGTLDDELDYILSPRYPKPDVTVEECKRYVFEAGLDGGAYEVWRNVGMALHHQFKDTEWFDAAFCVWDEWSATQPGYEGTDDVRKYWDSFRDEAKRPITMHWVIAKWRGKNRPDTVEFTEMGRVARFVECFGGKYRYAVNTKQWYRWDQVHWEPIEALELSADRDFVLGKLLREDVAFTFLGVNMDDPKCKEQYKKAQALIRRMSDVAPRQRFQQFFEKIPELQCRSTDFNASQRYFGVGNGDIDLQTGELLPPSPERLISTWTDACYSEFAVAPTWERIVAEVFSYNTENIRYFQRFCGYMLYGEQTEEVMLILQGDGANGKTTLLNGLSAAFGGYSAKLAASAITTKGRRLAASADAATPSLAAIAGKRFVRIEETPQDAYLDSDKVKGLVSHGGVVLRDVYKSILHLPITWSFIMATNYPPNVRENDWGTWRRLSKITLLNTFPKDGAKKLDAKLEEERDGILMWCLQGKKEYDKIGLAEPPAIAAERKQYQEQQDVIGEYLKDSCVYGRDAEGVKTPVTQIYANYKEWYKERFVDFQVGTCKSFISQVMKATGLPKERTRPTNGGNPTSCLIGIRLRDDELDFPSTNAEVEDLF